MKYSDGQTIEEHNKALFDIFRKLNLPLGEYCIVSGGPLAIRGIKKTGDVDVIVSEKLWNDLESKYEKILAKNNEVEVEVIRPIEDVDILHFIKETPIKGKPTTEEQIDNADLIEGLLFQNLNHCLFFKKWSGREKDQKDIELLKKYLAENPKEKSEINIKL